MGLMFTVGIQINQIEYSDARWFQSGQLHSPLQVNINFNVFLSLESIEKRWQ